MQAPDVSAPPELPLEFPELPDPLPLLLEVVELLLLELLLEPLLVEPLELLPLAATVVAVRKGDYAGRDEGRGTAGRAAERVVGVPGIACGNTALRLGGRVEAEAPVDTSCRAERSPAPRGAW